MIFKGHSKGYWHSQHWADHAWIHDKGFMAHCDILPVCWIRCWVT